MKRTLLLTVALALALHSALLCAQTTSPLSIDDLYRFDAPADLVVGPSGDRAVYSRRWADADARIMRHSLWIVEGDAAQRRPLEAGEPDGRRPLLSPDGKWVVFHSTRPFPDGTPAVTPVPPYSDPATDLWFLSLEGGPAIPLAGKDKPYGRVFTDPFYGRVAFSPDGRRLVFVADDGDDPRTAEELRNGVEMVRDDQGEGYEGYGAAQIWIAELAESPGAIAATRIVRVTDDDVWYGDPQWLPDGSGIVVHANRSADREAVRYSINKNYDLWQLAVPESLDGYDPRTAALRQLTTGPGPEVSPRLAPDGRQLVCLSVPRKGSHADVFNLLLVDLTHDAPRSEVLFDHHSQASSPARPPAFPLPADCWLGSETVYYTVNHRTETTAEVVDIRTRHVISDSPATVSSAHQQASEQRRKLTPPANEYLESRDIGPSEVIRWQSPDHLELEGVLTLPPASLGGKAPYPLVLYPHGGPHSRSTSGFNFTAQILAAAGYAVFQPNFRGSAGYGQKFIDADRFDLGGNDMRDILSGIEYLIATNRIDPNRQFVYGISYGGYTTCMLIGQTHQFRAAVPQNAVTDLHMMWGLSDIPSWTEWEFGGLPWQAAERMRERSPLTYAARVRTPTLILHSKNDRRCPLPMGIVYYRALQAAGVETQMVLYPDEPHGIAQLPHQEDVLRRVLDWFRQHDVRSE